MEESLIGLGFIFTFFVLLTVGALILLAPAIIAFRRQHPNRWLILAVCVFLGGTGIGWGIALVWALRTAHRSPDADGSHGGESGLNLFENDMRRLWSDNSSEKRERGIPRDTEDVLQQLERLERLREGGHLDEIEFARLKTAALSQL